MIPVRYWVSVWSAVAILGSVPVALPADDSTFHPPVLLQAGGTTIDHGNVWGHAGPAMADINGDGLDELIVGDFGGGFMVYTNLGEEGAPEFGIGIPLQAGGEVANVWIY